MADPIEDLEDLVVSSKSSLVDSNPHVKVKTKKVLVFPKKITKGDVAEEQASSDIIPGTQRTNFHLNKK
jgi:hypothetical protein